MSVDLYEHIKQVYTLNQRSVFRANVFCVGSLTFGEQGVYSANGVDLAGLYLMAECSGVSGSLRV